MRVTPSAVLFGDRWGQISPVGWTSGPSGRTGETDQRSILRGWFLLPLAFLVLVAGAAHAADAPEAGKDVLVRTELPLKTPRSRDPVLGGSRDKVFFAAWIPEGVTTVRGAVCNPFSRDEPVGSHWKAACRYWQFA